MSEGTELIPAALREILVSPIGKRVFESLDTDSSGDVSIGELSSALTTLGLSLTTKAIRDIVDLFDTDGDGKISLAEWNDWLDQLSGGGAAVGLQAKLKGLLLSVGQEEMQSWFDNNGNPTRELTPEDFCVELAKYNIHTTTSEVASLFRKIDASNDGFISYAEMAAYLNQQEFDNSVTNLMKKAARQLRARGTDLPSVLLAAAIKEDPQHVLENEANLEAVSLSVDAIKRVLLRQLGLPLSVEKMEAVIAMADINGDGNCAIGELCMLAGEDCSLLTLVSVSKETGDDDFEEDTGTYADGAGSVWVANATNADDWWSTATPASAPATAEAQRSLPATQWLHVSDALFELLAVKVEGGNSSMLELRRIPQALAFLGLPMPAALAHSLGSKHQTSPGWFDKLGFRSAVFEAVHHQWQQQRLALRPLAKARLLQAFATVGHGDSQSFVDPTSDLSCGGPVLHRWQIVNVLLRHFPLLSLNEEELVTLAFFFPGMHREAAVERYKSIPAEPDNFGSGTVIMRSSGISAFGVSTPSRGALHSARSAAEKNDTYVSDLWDALLSLHSVADVDVNVLVAWLYELALHGACVEHIHNCSLSGLTQDEAMVTRDPEYLLLPEAAKSAVRKLTSPLLALPCLHAWKVDETTGALQCMSVTLERAQALPASFYPSRLAPIAHVSGAMSLQEWLLDGGFEYDPGALQPQTSATSTATMPVLPSPTASTPGGTLSAASSPAAQMQPLTSPSVAYSVAAKAQAVTGEIDKHLGLTMRYTSIVPGAPPANANCVPVGSKAAPPSLRLRQIGAAANTADLAWASEGMLVRSAIATAVVDVNAAKAVPSPSDDTFRQAVLGRVIRVALAQMSVPTDPGQAPSLRLLSNVVSLHASWSPLTEDEWTFASASANTFNRLILRSDGPRDAGGPTSCLVVFELNLQILRKVGTVTPLHAVDAYATEEITSAWGVVPLVQLCGQTVTHRVKLIGGSPGCAADIDARDILQRRTNWRAVAKAVMGNAAVPELVIAGKSLTKFSLQERIRMGELPLNVALSFPHLRLVAAARRVIASVLLASAQCHLPIHETRMYSAFVSALKHVVALLPPGGANAVSPLSTLANMLDAEVKKLKGGNEEDALVHLLRKLLPAAHVLPAGLGLPPQASTSAFMADICSKYAAIEPSMALSDPSVLFWPTDAREAAV